LVGAEGFEPPTSCSQSRRATSLRHAPTFFRLGQSIPETAFTSALFSDHPDSALRLATPMRAGQSCHPLGDKGGGNGWHRTAESEAPVLFVVPPQAGSSERLNSSRLQPFKSPPRRRNYEQDSELSYSAAFCSAGELRAFLGDHSESKPFQADVAGKKAPRGNRR
jgi:hypothetical protein